MRTTPHALWIAFALGASACVGSIGDDDAEPGVPPTIASESSIGASDLRRLSQREYASTLRDLFGAESIDPIASALDLVPSDAGGEGFSTMNLNVSAVHVDGYYAVADALSDWFATDPTRLAPLAPCFAEPLNDTCVDGFVRDFGRLLFRRPVTTDEQGTMMELFGEGQALSDGDGVRLVLLYMLQTPAFLYRLELDGEVMQGLDAVYTLTPYELATRLSYFAWGSAPDAQLLDAAADGSLDSEEGYQAQLSRLLADDRARGQVRSFFAEWLDTEALPQVQQPSAFLDGIDGTNLADDMQEEMERFVEHQIFEAQADFTTLMTTDETFVTSPELAAIYGVPASSPDELVSVGPERAGLLTRPALLVGNGVTTHPIQRGAHLRAMMLCQVLPAPDPADFPPNAIEEPTFDPTKTSRERWAEQTEPDNCAGCHNQINPFGFALEHFDTIGRYRELESIIDPTTGDEVNQLPVDATVDVFIDGLQPVSGAVELGQALAASETAQRCFAQQWFRYATGRHDADDDDEVIDAMSATVAESTLLAMMERLALTPQFKLRKVH